MLYENQQSETYPQPGESTTERLASWNTSERRIRKKWSLDYEGFESSIIGEGAQTWVLGNDSDEVIKLNKPIDAITEYVEAWGHKDLDVSAVVKDLVAERTQLIRARYYETQPADLLGHIALQPVRNDARAFEAALWLQGIIDDQDDHESFPLGPTVVMRQPRCKELVGDFLEHADTQQAAKLFTDYTNFIKRQFWHGVSETTYKFGEQYGVMDDDKKIWDNPLLLLDAGERTMYAAEVYRHIISKRWRQVFNGKDAQPLPRHLELYYEHMDRTLPEDVFHTIWDQQHSLRFNAPGRTSHSYHRPAGILRGAFEHAEWRDFCLDALDDIDRPKAMVIEFEEPVAPLNDVMYPNRITENRYVYPGMIAYYRQLAPNPLLDNPDKPVWMWELQFLTSKPLHGILKGEPDSAHDSWGVTLMLRENDYTLNDTYFTGNSPDRLARKMDSRLPNGTEIFLKSPSENALRPELDTAMLKMFQHTTIKSYRIIDGYPFDAQP